MAMTWNGTTWQLAATADPAGGGGSPLAEVWNGTSWSQLTAPNPHAENGSSFTAVDCAAAGRCEVTGDYDYADVAQSVIAYGLNGTSWTGQKQVNPAGGNEFNSNTGVSCTSVAACTSAGIWSPNFSLGLAERWNGTSWSRQAVPHPPSSVTDSLAGVSCTAVAACTAVGQSANNLNDSPSVTMAMTWNGTSWQLAATPNRAGTSDVLSGVSCTTPTTCVAVGSSLNFPSGATLVEVSSG